MTIEEMTAAAAAIEEITTTAELICDIEVALFDHDYTAAEIMAANLMTETNLTDRERDKVAMLYLLARRRTNIKIIADDIALDAEEFFAI